jgi:hypothetical protein
MESPALTARAHRDDLVAVKAVVLPLDARATFRAAEHAAVERLCRLEVVHGERVMKYRAGRGLRQCFVFDRAQAAVLGSAQDGGAKRPWSAAR